VATGAGRGCTWVCRKYPACLRSASTANHPCASRTAEGVSGRLQGPAAATRPAACDLARAAVPLTSQADGALGLPRRGSAPRRPTEHAPPEHNHTHTCSPDRKLSTATNTLYTSHSISSFAGQLDPASFAATAALRATHRQLRVHGEQLGLRSSLSRQTHTNITRSPYSNGAPGPPPRQSTDNHLRQPNGWALTSDASTQQRQSSSTSSIAIQARALACTGRRHPQRPEAICCHDPELPPACRCSRPCAQRPARCCVEDGCLPPDEPQALLH